MTTPSLRPPYDPAVRHPGPGRKRRPLPVPPAARTIHKRIVAEIKRLLASDVRSALDPEFRDGYATIMRLLEQYQQKVVSHSRLDVSCSKGCTRCCFHWVEDVYSFETEIIIDYIKKNLPEHIPSITDLFARDVAEMERLDSIVGEKLAASASDEDVKEIDSVDLLLASFYQLRRPCAFLGHGGECSIYPVRPLTCRIYISFSEPVYCDPDYINVADVRTYLLDLQEEASGLLDQLHMEFDRFEGDMGLRSLMAKYLQASGR